MWLAERVSRSFTAVRSPDELATSHSRILDYIGDHLVLERLQFELDMLLAELDWEVKDLEYRKEMVRKVGRSLTPTYIQEFQENTIKLARNIAMTKIRISKLKRILGRR